MISFAKKLILTAAVAACSVSAHALVLDFESSTPNTFMDAPINGFSFGPSLSTFWFTDTEAAQSSAFYQAKSGTMMAFHQTVNEPNTFVLRDSFVISNATPFAFEGAWFSGTPVGANAVQVSYKLYDSTDALVHTTSLVNLPALDGNVFVASNYGSLINKVVVYGHQGYYGMDDFTYQLSPIPEPGTYAMLLLGLGLVGAVAARRQRG